MIITYNPIVLFLPSLIFHVNNSLLKLFNISFSLKLFHFRSFACIQVCIPYVCSVHGGQKRVLEPPGTGTTDVNGQASSGNWTQSSAKSSQCFKLQSYLSQHPHCFLECSFLPISTPENLLSFPESPAILYLLAVVTRGPRLITGSRQALTSSQSLTDYSMVAFFSFLSFSLVEEVQFTWSWLQHKEHPVFSQVIDLPLLSFAEFLPWHYGSSTSHQPELTSFRKSKIFLSSDLLSCFTFLFCVAMWTSVSLYHPSCLSHNTFH